MDLKEIRKIVELMNEHELSYFHLEEEGVNLKLKKGADIVQVAQAAMPAAAAPVAATPTGDTPAAADPSRHRNPRPNGRHLLPRILSRGRSLHQRW